MKSFPRMGLLFSLFAILIYSVPASANLCRDKHISVRDTQEATHLGTLPFSSGSYAGNLEYDALVIGCNRRRDSRGKMIEESFQPADNFPTNLPPRLIKGTIAYYGKIPVRYGYELQRINGEWLVTVPLKFDFDTPNHPSTLDIPIELARSLGLVVRGGECDDSNRNNMTPNKATGNGFILRGVDESSGGHFGDDSCRLPKTFTHQNQSIQSLLGQFWIDSINNFWSRPGIFKVNAIDYDSLSIDEKNRYFSAKAYWIIKFNSRPQSRALYKPVTTKPTPLYSGEPSYTIAHEFGHALGLDDEYSDGNGKPWRHCKDRSSPQNYVMCKMPHPGVTNGVLGSLSATYNYAKGVYPWIVTRRYAAETCKQDTDCGDGEYCATGAIKNHCEAKRHDGDKCSADKQCGTNLTCVNKPMGNCVFEKSLTMNQRCRVNEQCTTGKCQGTGNSRTCVCNSNSHCPSGSYCRNRSGKNECRILHSEYSSCSSDSQCGSGMVCNNKPMGHCINSSSKSLGARCEYNNECTTGKCQGSGNNRQCVCNANSHCATGQYCNNRMGQNRCLANASVAIGQGCNTNNECSTGKCQGSGSTRKCVCNSNSHCATGQYCNNRAGQNRCLANATKAIGQSCVKNKECSTNKCEQSICVCRKNSDCPSSQKCKTPPTKKNYCK